MARKKKKHHEEEGGEAWLLPYSDLMTLLLAVFIVLFAVSKVDQNKAEEISKAFREGMMTGSESVFPGNGHSIISIFDNNSPVNEPKSETEENQEAGSITAPEDSTVSHEELEKFLGKYELEDMEKLKILIDDISQHEGITSDMTSHIDTRGLVISLNNTVLFGSGSADIKLEHQNTLLKIANVINKLDKSIRIEGHTDNIPIHTAVYPSNWELSTARAASVVRLFIDKCEVSPEKVVAVGYGEYKPVADNATEDGRAKNRRIDIIVLSEKYNNLED